jgi:hypothetical protein
MNPEASELRPWRVGDNPIDWDPPVEEIPTLIDLAPPGVNIIWKLIEECAVSPTGVQDHSRKRVVIDHRLCDGSGVYRRCRNLGCFGLAPTGGLSALTIGSRSRPKPEPQVHRSTSQGSACAHPSVVPSLRWWAAARDTPRGSSGLRSGQVNDAPSAPVMLSIEAMDPPPDSTDRTVGTEQPERLETFDRVIPR